MSHRRFLYYLLRPDGRSGSVVNGVVTYTGVKRPLPQTPEGWQELQLEWDRNKDKHGLNPSVSLPFGLVRDGARITRDALYKETVESRLQLLIQRLKLRIDNINFNYVYEYFFRGELDLPKTEDTLDMCRVPIKQGEVQRLVDSNKDTIYQFPMTDPRCVNLFLDGIEKEYIQRYTVEQEQAVSNNDLYFLGMHRLSSEGNSGNIAFFDVPFQSSSPYPNDDYFTETDGIQVVRIKSSDFAVFFNISTGILLRVETNDGGTGGFPQYDLIPIGPDEPAGSVKIYSFDVLITIPTNTRLNIKLADTATGGLVGLTVTGGNIEITYNFREEGTYCKAWKRFDMGQEIVKRVAPMATFTSQLCTDFNGLLITSGQAIRQLPDAVLPTSLNDFYGDTDATLMAGMAVVGDNVEIEDRRKYYSEDEVTDLGKVTDFVKKPAEDKMCNTFRFGHAKQDIEDINGKYDPNGNNQFTGPYTIPDPKEYKQVSKYKGGPYEIDKLRERLVGQTTTDNDSDNDVFVIAAVGTGNKAIEVTFDAALGGVILADADGFLAAQQIRVIGSVSNDRIYDISSIASNGTNPVLVFAQPVTNEGPVTVTIEFLQGEVYTLDREAYDQIEGVPNQTIFNLKYLTPKRMLIRHLPWLAGMHAGLTAPKAVFANGKENRNTALLTRVGSVTIDEDADQGLTGSPMFLPWYFIFKTEVPINLPELLEENPNRCFKFTNEYEQEWTGFLISAGIAINDYTPQEFRLLAAPSNDITKLIH